MINRAIAPEFHPVKAVEFLKPEKKDWNGIPVWIFHQPGSGVYRLELIFKAGEKYQPKPLIAKAMAAQMTEGTQTLNSKAFAELFDTCGASIQVETEKDYLSVTVYGLTENAAKIAKPATEVIYHAVFPQEQLQLYVDKNIQRMQINRQKVDVLAREKFAQVVYGENSSNGKILENSDWKSLTRHELISFYNSQINQSFFEIVVSGDCPAEFLKTWENSFSGISVKNKTGDSILKTEFTPGKYKVHKPDALQNAIIMAVPVINRQHPDFPKLQMTNLVLGGYFGSRLMSNIREDKGYTYGIGSGIRVTNDHAYLSISTEVGADVCEAALKEIYFEINRLKTESISAQELELARNYMLGSFIRNSDGPLAMADRFKSVHFAGMNYSYYDHYLQCIHTITANEIQQMSKTYFDLDKMVEIVAGK